MRLSFRRRVFLGLVGLGTLPLAVALLVLALQARSTGSPAGLRASLDEIARSGGVMIGAVDTTALSDSARAALRAHTETIARRTSLARQAETLTRTAAGALAAIVFVAALVVIALSVTTARRLSALTSAPIEELVQWVRRIERQEPVPDTAAHRGAPEFDALRGALREMSDALERARHEALERERLTAFRETARRVAHEMRGPLTAARLALRGLARDTDPAAGHPLRVLEDETRRLEAMATEFAEFGRLPEGPEAPVNVAELLESVTATAPEVCRVVRQLEPDLVVRGHYEALRRAFENLVRNAIEATDERGIAVTAARGATVAGAIVRVVIADHGPGVAAEHRDRIFDPYFTTKRSGTGLGLAMTRQTVVAHDGTITVEPREPNGTAFVVELPASHA